MKIKIVVLTTLIGSLLIASCGPNQPASDMDTETAPKVWFDAPLPNSVFYHPNPITMVMHAADVEGVTSFELSVNGKVVAEIPSPNTSDSLVTLTYEWHPPDPGKYLMTVRAKNHTGTWSPYAETAVIVSNVDIPRAVQSTGSPTPTETATHRPVEFPTSTNTPQPATITIERISTNLVYLGSSSCGPLDVTITARATVTENIKVVVLFYRIQTGNASSDFQSIGMVPIGDGIYQQSINPTSLLGGSVPFDQATLQYQVVVQQNDGDTSVRTKVIADIAMKACGSASSACSVNTTERSCIANGCQWVTIPGTVPTYQCKNP